jgi:hypothetical protein
MDNSEIQKSRIIFNKVSAIMSRASQAGIPDAKLRISSTDFKKYLCPTYHKDIDSLASSIYDSPDKTLFSRPYIIIDGGDIATRKSIGFATLFRMIACDKYGLYKDCADMVHKLQVIRSTQDENRNEIAETLKTIGILFISETRESLFNQHFDSGSLFDEILSYREDNMLPTIISFTNLIHAGNKITHNDAGIYLKEIFELPLRNGSKSERFIHVRGK